MSRNNDMALLTEPLGWYLCLVLLGTNLVHSQLLNGNGYVEKQLLCALDRAPCDNLGKQIKGNLCFQNCLIVS